METAFFDIDIVTAVELITFEAIEGNGKVIIKWETSTEKNTIGFNILKSNEKDREFTQINEKLIECNSKRIYYYTDIDVEAGRTYYYILESVDMNGETNLYRTVSITLKIPQKYELYQNYPNPFNPITNIKFDIPKNEKVTLKIYNILGQEIKTLINAEMNAGAHTVQWDGTNNIGIKVASGVYIYQVKAGKFAKAKKMSFVK